MHAMPTDTAAPPLPTDAEKARARLNRIAAPVDGLDRPLRSDSHAPVSRDQRAPARQPRHGAGKREGFRLGWGGWLVVELLAIAVIVATYLAWPPTVACREQEAKLGFYAGDSLGKCIRRGVAARLDDADQRLKMLLRGSGK